MRFRPNIPSVVLLVLLSLGLCGPGAAAKELLYLQPGQIDLQAVLPPPPAEPSPAEAAELAELHRIEGTRSPEQAEQALRDEAEEDVFIFRTVLGRDFTAERLPVVAGLFEQVRNDASLASKSGKQAWHRRRPQLVDPTLHPVGHGSSPSYPSGHAMLGWTDGVLLAALIPAKREEILSRAADYAHNRLICGVHFPSDIAASQVAGTLIAQTLLQNPRFQEKFAAAREELRAVPLTASP